MNETVRELSDQLVALQQPIRILDAVTWDDEVAGQFFANGGREMPVVDADYYRNRRPLRFEPEERRTGFADLRSRVTADLGGSAVAGLLLGRIDEYLKVIDLLEARGTPAFATISAELYGAPTDELHPDGPTLAELGALMTEALSNIDSGAWESPEGSMHDAMTSVGVLKARLEEVCGTDQVRVIIDDGIVADAAAGGDYIKLHADATFSERDLRILEVHEGWVHVVTTLNGRSQPWCTFFGKGTPSTTATQEGLAVVTEITTLSSTPDRLRRVTGRVTAIAMAQEGASFLDVHQWFLAAGATEADAWASSVRVFRGSGPTMGPFTKDLSYSRGFLEVYDFMRLAVRKGQVDRLPLLFGGKLAIREMGAIAQLVDEGLITGPPIIPPHFSDLSALASWLAYSNLLNRINLAEMEHHLQAAFA